jgi:hypothetical protein
VNMGPLGGPEMSVSYHRTPRKTPEDGIIQICYTRGHEFPIGKIKYIPATLVNGMNIPERNREV